MCDKSLKTLFTTRNYPMHQCTLGAEWLKSSFAEKELEFLVGTRLKMRQK